MVFFLKRVISGTSINTINFGYYFACKTAFSTSFYLYATKLIHLRMSTKLKGINGLRGKNYDQILFPRNNYYEITLVGLLNAKGPPICCSCGPHTGIGKEPSTW